MPLTDAPDPAQHKIALRLRRQLPAELRGVPDAVLLAHLKTVDDRRRQDAAVPKGLVVAGTLAVLAMIVTLFVGVAILPGIRPEVTRAVGFTLLLLFLIGTWGWARRQDRHAAAAIAELLEARGDLPRHCVRCGYDLFGLDGHRCPECGEDPRVPPPGRVATEALRPRKPRRANRFHPALRELHPDVAHAIHRRLMKARHWGADAVFFAVAVPIIAVAVVMTATNDDDVAMWLLPMVVAALLLGGLAHLAVRRRTARRRLAAAVPCWFCGDTAGQPCGACGATNIAAQR